jgi:hypothetical protein
VTYKERENRLILEMENRTAYDDGLTIPELCKRVLDYEMQSAYGKSIENEKRQKWKLGEDGKYYVGDDMSYVEPAHFDKIEEDQRRIKQIKQMLKRTRNKYKSGSRSNDTTIDRHQYYLIPPKLQDKNRLWRCVHFVPGINQHLFEPLIMRSDQQEAALDRKRRRLNELAQISDEEAKKILDDMERKILLGATIRKKGKKDLEEKEKELKKAKPSEFDTKLDSY